MNSWSTRKLGKLIFSENAVAYALYSYCDSRGSKVFFQLKHNLRPKERHWSYHFAPDVDLVEIKPDKTIIAYELKGVRSYKNDEKNWPGFYDGLGQALAYLNLPIVWENNRTKFNGGAFDYVYLVHARPEAKLDKNERQILSLVPMIGFGLIVPDGTFQTIQGANPNPLLNQEVKSHFLDNLHTLDKFSVNGRTFRRIKEAGESYFKRYET